MPVHSTREEAVNASNGHVQFIWSIAELLRGNYDADWVRERRATDDFLIREIDRDKVVLFGRP